MSRFPARLSAKVRKLLLEQDAATTVEYAVMLGLILLTALGAIGTFGSETGGLWSGILGKLQAVGFMP
ncbi:Flp family type IVb pilin [Thermopirellula anaerolimosa]